MQPHFQHLQQHPHHHQPMLRQHQQHQQLQHQQLQLQAHQHQIQYQQPQISNLGSLREIKLIASSFVKQYYTLLNKAPCFIYNFYNHDSTFIYGTIEMGSELHTEPVVGRENIENKMKELKLNDCRTKIKQIDCLETLAGGLVIQVIGELSNNGRPMRRFLQTFVLAPSPDQPTAARQDGDLKSQARTAPNSTSSSSAPNNPASGPNAAGVANVSRTGVQISENNSTSSSHNQKFYVLNSIFRYQDDGPDSEFEDDSINVQVNSSIESANGATNEINNDNHNDRAKPVAAAQQQPLQQPQQQPPPPPPPQPQSQPQSQPQPQSQSQPQQLHTVPKSTAPIITNVSVATLNQPTVSETGPVVEPAKRGVDFSQNKVAPIINNGTGNSSTDKRSEITAEKASTENAKPLNISDNQSQASTMHPPKSEASAQSGTTASTQGSPSSTVAAQQSSAPAPRPPNEPKTWANMVRNALPQSSSTPLPSATSSRDQQPSPNQASSNQTKHPQTNQQTPQNQAQNEQQNAQNSNSNNRRRHMLRKPSSKTGAGRQMKNRNPRPQAPPAAPAAPAASTGKPAA